MDMMILPLLAGMTGLLVVGIGVDDSPDELAAGKDRDETVNSLRTRLQEMEKKVNQVLKDVRDQKGKTSKKLKRKIEKRKLELQKARLDLEEKLEKAGEESEAFWQRTKKKMLKNWEKLDRKVQKLLG